MSTLYRTYRPSTFDDVVGQDHAVAELRALLAGKDFPHSLILVGGRGIGKTTLARIVAGEMGCDQMDIYELDAASNNGVDNIRDLREEINTLPMMSPFKVYILDEVHMLSKQAWNAFLKTLEEPPAHVKFIMATTEVHAIPETIVSRSRVIRLHTPSAADIAAYVTAISKKESFKLSPDTAEIIAVSAQGSFRDSLVALQTIIANNATDAAAAGQLLGVPALSWVRDWILALYNHDAAAAIAILGSVESAGSDAGFFLDLAIIRIRAALQTRIGMQVVMENPADTELLQTVTAGAKPISTNHLDAMIDAIRSIKTVPNGIVLLELLSYRLCA